MLDTTPGQLISKTNEDTTRLTLLSWLRTNNTEGHELGHQLVTSLMRGVGHCECGILSDIAHGVVKDHLLGYISLSNHLYRPHVVDGVDKPSK